MSRVPVSLLRSVFVLLVICCAFELVSCGFHPTVVPISCGSFDETNLTPLSSQSTQFGFQDVGTIAAIHGTGTAKVDHTNIIKVQQSVPLPGYADKATVFLNGWRANYPGGDHHVINVGTGIGNIKSNVDPDGKNRTLSWIATGSLADNGDNKGMNWSYFFTVIAWNSTRLNLFVDHGPDGGPLCSPPPSSELNDNYFYADSNNPSSANSAFYSFLQNPGFSPGNAIALLPRGFDFLWNEGNDDHHLRQLSYNLDHSETFAEHRKYNKKGTTAVPDLPDAADHVAGDVVSWTSNAIFKDNDTQRPYIYSELDSGLAGPDVGLVQPPFASVPTDDGDSIFSSCGSTASPGIRSQDIEIRNIPYAYAIPMLTGWDVQYLCSDQHVKEIGVWIDNWVFDTPTPGGPGRIRYRVSSVLRDDDNTPDFLTAHKITILGLKPIVTGKGGAGNTGTGGKHPGKPTKHGS
jgi:hypothetical protein